MVSTLDSESSNLSSCSGLIQCETQQELYPTRSHKTVGYWQTQNRIFPPRGVSTTTTQHVLSPDKVVSQNHLSSQVFWNTTMTLGSLTLPLPSQFLPCSQFSHLHSSEITLLPMKLFPTFVLLFMLSPLPRRWPPFTPVLSFTSPATMLGWIQMHC